MRKPAWVPPEYRLTHRWNFRAMTWRTLRLDFQTRYRTSRGSLDYLNDEWTRQRDMHQLDRGGLHLTAGHNGNLYATGGLYGSMVRTKARFLPPCAIVAWCRIPKAPATKCSFWLPTSGSNAAPDGDISKPELDIFEITQGGLDYSSSNYASGPRSAETSLRSFHNLHNATDPQSGTATLVAPSGLLTRNSASSVYTPGYDFADGVVREFGVHWRPTKCAHYAGGVELADRDYEWVRFGTKDPAPAGQIILAIDAGGAWPGKPLSGDDFPANFTVTELCVWGPS